MTRRRIVSPLKVTVFLLLAFVAPQHAFQNPPAPPPPVRLTDPVQLPVSLFQLPADLEVTVWATTPLLRNPTNIDIDARGRVF